MRGSLTRTFAAVVGAVTLTVIAYSAVFFCDFVSFDDREYVYNNRHVLEGLSASGWRYAWTTFDCSNWHPLTWLSLELDATFWGKNPHGYHATNLIFHCLNGVLLFLVLNRATRCFYRSLCVALLFLLHPLHVESVAWIAERKDVLSTFFLLLTLAAYLQYSVSRSWTWYGALVSLFSLGLLAKPMLVTLPVLLLLIDFWPLKRMAHTGGRSTNEANEELHPFSVGSFPQRVREKIPLFILSFLDGLVTIFAQNHATATLNHLTWIDRIANSLNACAWYLQKTFLPVHLAVFYPHPEHEWQWSSVLIGFLIVVIISTWVVWIRETAPYALVGWGWFCVSLVPVIGLLQVGGQAYADRYSYVPHIGLFILIVWTVNAGIQRTSAPVSIGCSLSILSLSACLWLTRSQVTHWRNSETLWSWAIQVNPDNGVAHAHLADLWREAGDCERVIHHIAEGLRIKRSGNTANAHLNWAMCLVSLGRDDEADSHFRQALRIDGSHTVALDEYAKFLQKLGRTNEAAQVSAHYAAVLAKQAQNHPDAAKELKLGIVLAKQGQFEAALSHFQESIRLTPQSAAAHNNLALTLVQLKRTEEAKANFRRAIELNPRLAVAHFCLAELLEAENDRQGAKVHFAEALRLNPQDEESRQALERLSSR